MQKYSEDELRHFYQQFRGLKKYTDKLAYFEKVFGLIPAAFPVFDPLLGFLLQREKVQELETLFRSERNNSDLTVKKFCFPEPVIFNIRPANSNSSVYSSYILTRFLSRQPLFSELPAFRIANPPFGALLDEANGRVNHIELTLQAEYNKAFSLQCMAVFYKGFLDAFTGHISVPDKKRKFTELFLYAQGIMYVHYIRFLNRSYFEKNENSEAENGRIADLKNRLSLLDAFGVVEFLRSQMNDRSPERENTLAEILSRFTKADADQRVLILGFLEEKKNGESSEMIHHP